MAPLVQQEDAVVSRGPARPGSPLSPTGLPGETLCSLHHLPSLILAQQQPSQGSLFALVAHSAGREWSLSSLQAAHSLACPPVPVALPEGALCGVPPSPSFLLAHSGVNSPARALLPPLGLWKPVGDCSMLARCIGDMLAGGQGLPRVLCGVTLGCTPTRPTAHRLQSGYEQCMWHSPAGFGMRPGGLHTHPHPTVRVGWTP